MSSSDQAAAGATPHGAVHDEGAIETGSHPAKPSIRLRRVPVEEEGGQVYVLV